MKIFPRPNDDTRTIFQDGTKIEGINNILIDKFGIGKITEMVQEHLNGERGLGEQDQKILAEMMIAGKHRGALRKLYELLGHKYDK